MSEEQDERREPARIHRTHEYEGITYPNFVVDGAIKTLRMFEVRTDDVWIASYPKSGAFWLQEIVTLITKDGFTERADRSLHRACIEMIDIGQNLPRNQEEEDDNPLDMTPFLEVADRAASPRVFASHLRVGRFPWELKSAKTIYIARNPKDVITSMYDFYEKHSPLSLVPFQEMLERFLEGKCIYGPWYEHVHEFWKVREQNNILFVFYEQLLEDPEKWIRRIAKHIDRPLSDDALQRVLDNSKMDIFIKRLSEDDRTGFRLQGKRGCADWKHQFTVTQNEIFDAWFKSKCKGARDLKFIFE